MCRRNASSSWAMTTKRYVIAALVAAVSAAAAAQQSRAEPEWAKVEEETMRHYQAVLRLDTRTPPGNEHIVAEYVKKVLDAEGIPSQIVGSDMNPPHLITRLQGDGREPPLLVVVHRDMA